VFLHTSCTVRVFARTHRSVDLIEMMFEESDVMSRTGLLMDEDLEAQNAFLPFIQMDDLFDKLKLINYENEFVKQCRVRPLNR